MKGGPVSLGRRRCCSARRGIASADMQGTGESGGWEKRIAVEPDPSKVVVPDGYEVGVFVKGLGAPSSATVDGDGNLWVAVAPPLLGSPEKDQFEEAHVKVFDPQGKLIKEIGKGTFTSNVMNEISYCPENGKVYIPEYARRSGRSMASTASSSWPSRICSSAITATAASPAATATSTSRSGCRRTPASPIRTTTAGPTSRTIRSGSSMTRGLRDHAARSRPAATSSIPVSTSNSSDGRLTGAWLPVGVPAEPGMKITAKVPCAAR